MQRVGREGRAGSRKGFSVSLSVSVSVSVSLSVSISLRLHSSLFFVAIAIVVAVAFALALFVGFSSCFFHSPSRLSDFQVMSFFLLLLFHPFPSPLQRWTVLSWWTAAKWKSCHMWVAFSLGVCVCVCLCWDSGLGQALFILQGLLSKSPRLQAGHT